MRKFLIISVSLAAFAAAPAMALAAEVVVVEPEVETWVMEQESPSVTFEGEVTIGSPFPDTVEVIEVPKFKKYKYAFVNKKRVVIDARTNRVIAVY